MPPFIGIDLGTTFTVGAAADSSGRPTVIGDAAGHRKTPSVVAFGARTPIVGRTAARSGPVVECMKTTLGDFGRRFTLPTLSLRPEELAALVLARIRADARHRLGAPVRDAVLTVPAGFDFTARQALRDAGRIAGLHVRRVLTDPAAAALAYRHRLPPECTVLVFALGGGMFDAGLLRLQDGLIEVRASTGDRRLGGWDWDNTLMRVLQDRLTAQGGPDLLAGEETETVLRRRARAAKHRLSSAPRTEVGLRHGDTTWRIPVSRADFESASGCLLRRSRHLVESLLESSRTEPAELHRVLLVGGPTRMPAVGRMLRPLLGRPLDRSIAPDEAVALGAASFARAPVVRDVASHGLGLIVRGRSGRLRNLVLVPAGTALPAEGGVVFAGDGSGRFVLDVTVGDSAEPEVVRTVERRTVLLEARSRTPVEIRCRYDEEESARVEVRTASDGRLVTEFAVRDRGAMDEVELATAADRTAGLPWV